MNAILEENKIGYIELKNLVISDRNVRTVKPEKAKDKELISSIAAKGLWQNLVVVECNKGNKYEVVAGGRRLAALNHLKAKGVIKASYLVPCALHDGSDITGVSLSENIKASMHPADEFMAYQEMVDEGKTVRDIAGEFGVSQNAVKKRLKLAGVSPLLVMHYRDGDLTLDQVIAFTVSEDHEKQVACYKELSPHNLNPHRIKNMLLSEALRSSHGMVKLVTLKAYKKAGGGTSSDLFEDTTYINDRVLLEDLALQLLEEKRAEVLAEGWKWAEVLLEQNGSNSMYCELTAELVGVPKKIKDTLKKKNAEMEALDDKDMDDWTDEDDKRQDELYDEIESLELEQDEYKSFTDDQKAVSGVLVSYDHTGRITLEKGLVKDEDRKLAFPPAEKKDGLGEVSSDLTDNQPIESQALSSDLAVFQLQALQGQLMQNDDLCFDLMVFTQARAVLGEMGWFDKALDINVNVRDLSHVDGINETDSADILSKYSDLLDVSWLGYEEESDKFKAFCELGRPQKKRILSYCTAASLKTARNNDLVHSVKEVLDFDLSAHWKPTKDNYFSRVRKGYLLEIGSKRMGEQFADDNQKLSKGQLAELLESRDEMAGWMPDSLS